jgi:8-oxo-dGTP pyrophosphatase MutT (NUDIX family)
MGKSNLDLVAECDNFPYRYDGLDQYKNKLAEYFEFKLEGCNACLGYVPIGIVKKFPFTRHWILDEAARTLKYRPVAEDGYLVQDFGTRNAILATELQNLREQKIFQVLNGWRGEEYPVYGPNRELLLSMERAATPLFGLVTYGVHMTGYVRTDEGLKIWAPRRALTKQTYPGMMDNTVAGGLSTGEEPFKCLIRECEEEASLPEDVVQSAEACGTLTYFHVRDPRAGGETGLCQPECQYIYDLELPPEVIPKPNDDETIDFQLLTIPEVKAALADGKFKPNCAMLLLEFFIRRGILTPENEPDYIEIVSRLHRKLEFPTR